MRKLIYIFLLFAACACTNYTVEKDNDNPLVYLPMNGFSLNEIWELDGGADNHYLNVYCSGLYSGTSSDIVVGFQVDPTLITTYNDDITQQYSGQVKELPAECYQITGNSVTIVKGESAAKIPIKFNVEKIKQLNIPQNEYYVIPIRLVSTSKYNLHDDVTFLNALYAVNLKEPLFYFFNNRNGLATQACKVVYGSEQSAQYMLMATGIPDGTYEAKVEYTPELLGNFVSGATALPESAFEIVNPTVKFDSKNSMPVLEVNYKSEGLAYNKDYYLPLTITSTSAYQADAERATLVVKVQMKNEYEKSYKSAFNVYNSRLSMTKAYSATKSVTSVANDVVQIQMVKNSTIAGMSSTSYTSSSALNNKYMRIKIIPTDNPEHYDIELIKITDMSSTNNSPATLELIPDTDSYYNSVREEFVLNYRFQYNGYWNEVTEIATSN
ncbi:MAG: DUF1735 domain-containing protein [Bacteroidales bacterium]|nr:DUF1735 domain-containing protein [Bacteroidales bacterium]